MKQQKPILHGRDHADGGADPIPGLNGGGGGALEWEDVGGSGTVDLTAYGSGSGLKYAPCTYLQVLPLTTLGVLKDISISGDRSQLIVAKAGVYMVSGYMEAGAFPPYPAHFRIGFWLVKNGSTYITAYGRQLGDAVSSGSNLLYEQIPFSTQLSLAAGAGIGLQAVVAEGHGGNDWGSSSPAGLQVQVGAYSLALNRIA